MSTVIEYPTSFRSQAEAAYHMLRTRPRLIRLTTSQRDRIVREANLRRAERERLAPTA
jgi:hypothetical protein